MAQGTDEPQLVGEDWEPSSFEDPGAAELGARIEAAEPLLVRRDALEGRCGIEDRELWQLGVRTAPAGALSTGGGILLRLVIVAAIAAMGLCLAIVVAGGASLGDADSRLGVPAGVAILVFVLLVAHALLRLAWSAAGRERERRLARRRVAVRAVAPLLDPNGRLTVAVLDGPGVLRVLLLWLRGHPQDADMLEARVVAERRVPRDEPSRAEDAVAALSDVAMLATRMSTDACNVEAAAGACGPLPATSPAAASRLVGARTSGSPIAARVTASRMRVGPDWQPDGTTEEGEAELARRLCRAKPRRWSAELLVPLIVDDVREARGAAPPMPTSTERKRRAPRPAWVTAPALAGVAFLLYFVVSAPSAGLATEIVMRGLFLAAAGWIAWKVFRPQILELPHRWRRRPLMRRVDDAACDAAASLESGLPGGHGTVVVATAEQNGRRVVRLVHLRRIVDAPEGTLEARVLAERHLEPEDDPCETVGRFLIVADDQAFTTQRGRERVERLRRLSRRLGVTSGRGRGRGALLREPLALLAVPALALTGVLAILAVVFAFMDGDQALPFLAASVVLGAVAAALIACCRRWTGVSDG
jgi:hypothetical protein